MVKYATTEKQILGLLRIMFSPFWRFGIDAQKIYLIQHIQLKGDLICLLSGNTGFGLCIFYVREGNVNAAYQPLISEDDNIDQFKKVCRIETGLDGDTLDFRINNLFRLMNGETPEPEPEPEKPLSGWPLIYSKLKKIEADQLRAELKAQSNQILSLIHARLKGDNEAGKKAAEMIKERKQYYKHLKSEFEL